LRDSRSGSTHRRGGKGKESTSTIISDDAPDEGLSRAKGSFTVHGKKASVITFGPDWHDIPAEERLKVRKHAQEAVQESGEDSALSENEAAPSVMSGGTAPTLSDAGINGDEEVTPRPSDNQKRVHPQRHVSSQTITRQTSNLSVNGQGNASKHDTDGESEVKIETPSKIGSIVKHDLAVSEEEDSEHEHAKLNGSKPQAVEA
jgi:hypothetical protein